MVIDDKSLNILCISIMHFLDVIKQSHYYFNVFDFFSRLYFTIIGETVFVSEDRFGVFRHHDKPYLVFDELKV